jgi:UTP--glucose-1-phosphate uridylyltransferase
VSRSPDGSPPIHRAVIPAAGRGRRLYPATRAMPKAMVTLVDRPAIQHVVAEAVAAGLDDLVIVVSPGSPVSEHFRPGDAGPEAGPGADELEFIASRARLRYVTQPHPAGLGHAVALAGTLLAAEPFAVLLADVVGAAADLREMIRLAECEQASVVALEEIPASQMSAHGCAVARPYRDHLVRIAAIAEKPGKEGQSVAPPATAWDSGQDDSPSPLKVAGRYVLRPEILPILAGLPAGYGGEIQLSDAITVLASAAPVLGLVSQHCCLDIGSPAGYLAASLTLALRRPGMRKLIYATLENEEVAGECQ